MITDMLREYMAALLAATGVEEADVVVEETSVGEYRVTIVFDVTYLDTTGMTKGGEA